MKKISVWNRCGRYCNVFRVVAECYNRRAFSREEGGDLRKAGVVDIIYGRADLIGTIIAGVFSIGADLEIEGLYFFAE